MERPGRQGTPPGLRSWRPTDGEAAAVWATGGFASVQKDPRRAAVLGRSAEDPAKGSAPFPWGGKGGAEHFSTACGLCTRLNVRPCTEDAASLFPALSLPCWISACRGGGGRGSAVLCIDSDFSNKARTCFPASSLLLYGWWSGLGEVWLPPCPSRTKEGLGRGWAEAEIGQFQWRARFWPQGVGGSSCCCSSILTWGDDSAGALPAVGQRTCKSKM